MELMMVNHKKIDDYKNTSDITIDEVRLKG